MADILMYTDMSRYNEEIRKKSVHLAKLNEIIDAYNAMDIGAITGNEFKSLVQNPASFVFDKMTNGQDVVIGGLKVNKTKAIEILQKPDGYDALKDLITAYQNTVVNWNHYLSSVDVDGVTGEIVIAQSVLDADLEASKYYAVTVDEQAALDMAQTIKTLWEEKFAGQRMPGIHFLQRLLIVETNPMGSTDIADTTIRINHQGIKGIRMNNTSF